jgi:hypothetical protein
VRFWKIQDDCLELVPGLLSRVSKNESEGGKLAPSFVLICWKFGALDWLAILRLIGWQFRNDWLAIAGKLG